MGTGTQVADIAVDDSSPTYCTVDDVSRTLMEPVPPSGEDAEGTHTRSDWEAAIIDAEDEVDRSTGTSWRPRRVKLEYQDFDKWPDVQNFMRVDLAHNPVLPLDAASGDALEVWDGGDWEDWLATKTEGRNEDYWLKEPRGQLYLRRGIWPTRLDEARVRVSYRYGHSDVPRAIRKATRFLAAADLLTPDAVGQGGNQGDVDQMSIRDKADKWEQQAYQLLARYQRWG